MARPLVVRVGDLLRDPGSRREIERSVDLGALATSTASTIPGTLVEVEGAVIAMAGGVEAVGTVAYDWYGECRRCLEDVTGHTEVAFREICQREPVDDDVLPIDGDHGLARLDLEPLVRELVLSSLPLAPLCDEACVGPDPERFPAATADELEEVAEDDEGERPPDPRWAALAELKLDEP